ncbi:MAG: SUMF1/EgtB/PvdO family nonheme iron enzyme, partial [Planctomycetota bacterium]
ARQSQLDAADADAARMRAEELAVLAEERAAEIERRADPGRLVLARETAEDLWPALPRTVPAYDAWLARYAEPLGANLPDHVRALEELRRDALPYDEEQQIADRAQHPMRPQLEEQEGKIDNAQRQLAGEDPRVPAPEGEDRLYLERALAAMEATADEIRSRLDERLTWRFTDPAVQEQHDHLAGLVRELEAFLGPDGLVDEVRQRRAQAIDVVAETVTDPEPAAEWRHALDDLAQLEVYRGVELAPQVGLRPLRRDPRSGLWEFWLPASGDAPFPTDDGWDLGEESGLVFVLVPGGTDLLGAQADDPQAPNHDPAAKADEGPVRAVTLPAYFVSKYELTQAQWRRLTGETPSQYTPNFRWFGSPPREEAITASGLSNPVESISHAQATRIATSLGLRLPSSEEWEFAARGGTDTPWWTGTTPASLQGAANVADGAVRRQGGPPNWTYTEELEDSYIVHAPVGSFAPNPFGLHDVLGNVWEWTKAQPGSNGLATRGGCYEHPADRARVTSREYGEPTAQSRFVGLRPVRSIEPSPAR